MPSFRTSLSWKELSESSSYNRRERVLHLQTRLRVFSPKKILNTPSRRLSYSPKKESLVWIFKCHPVSLIILDRKICSGDVKFYPGHLRRGRDHIIRDRSCQLTAVTNEGVPRKNISSSTPAPQRARWTEDNSLINIIFLIMTRRYVFYGGLPLLSREIIAEETTGPIN